MFRFINKLSDKIINWKHYNQTNQNNREDPRLFSYLTITMTLIVKRIFLMSFRGLQEFISFVFKLAQLPLLSMH
nr:transposase [Candidatus Enterovibrio luxaltus]